VTVTHLGEGVDSEYGEVGLRLGVVHEVEVDQFLELQVVSLHAVHHIGEQGAGETRSEGNGGLLPSANGKELGSLPDVLSNGHACNNLLHCLLFPELVLPLEIGLQLGQFTCAAQEAQEQLAWTHFTCTANEYGRDIEP